MTLQTKSILALVGAVIIGIAIWGGYQYPKALVAVGSAAGSTFNTAKVAAVTMAPSTTGANATTSSILNGDASDRKIQSLWTDCSGVGTSLSGGGATGLASAGWILSAATTSTSVPTQVSTNNAIAIPLSTSTPDSYNIVGTATTTTAVSRVWAAGSYLTFSFNATNTAACVVGVNYVGS